MKNDSASGTKGQLTEGSVVIWLILILSVNWERQNWQLSFLFCLFWGMLAAAVLAPTSGAIASLLDPDPEVVAIASKYLVIVPISYASTGVIMIASATLNALGKPMPSVI